MGSINTIEQLKGKLLVQFFFIKNENWSCYVNELAQKNAHYKQQVSKDFGKTKIW